VPNAIVTGASKGLGRALATQLATKGWQVVIDARHEAELAGTAGEIGEAAHPVVGDVTDPEHRRRLVAEAGRLGGLDLLVNNAGTLGPSPLPRVRDLEPAALADALRTNVEAPLGLIQLALPLLEASAGTVINVTSDAALAAYEGWGCYGATKAALEQLSNVLAEEEKGLKVYWFDPGDLRTDMHQAAFPGEDISDRRLPEEIAPTLVRLLSKHPPSGRYRAADLLDPA
jgi:NAD(P)-dependent dehydrogenase (short-subunit alcohol dehydrogenase family)